jgi:hypothetical protein
MSTPRKKRPADFNQRAYQVFQEAIGEAPTAAPDDRTDGVIPPEPEKDAHAVALGHLGGIKGGKARADSLSAARRSEIAKQAAKARWDRVSKD